MTPLSLSRISDHSHSKFSISPSSLPLSLLPVRCLLSLSLSRHFGRRGGGTGKFKNSATSGILHQSVKVSESHWMSSQSPQILACRPPCESFLAFVIPLSLSALSSGLLRYVLCMTLPQSLIGLLWLPPLQFRMRDDPRRESQTLSTDEPCFRVHFNDICKKFWIKADILCIFLGPWSLHQSALTQRFQLQLSLSQWFVETLDLMPFASSTPIAPKSP